MLRVTANAKTNKKASGTGLLPVAEASEPLSFHYVKSLSLTHAADGVKQ